MGPAHLSIGTYNCHGFNQGSIYLRELLMHNDIICIQEHWLNSNECDKLSDLNNDFSVIASYPVDSVLNRGILKGRPFGGLAIFVRANLIKRINVVCKEDRLIIVQINNFMICNVYMPCDNNELFCSILGSMSDFICNRDNSVDHYCVMGDFNCSYTQYNPLWSAFHCFTDSCKLECTLSDNKNNSLVTYRHATLNNSSMIDYIFVSESLCKYVLNTVIADSGVNISDHIPVVVTFNADVYDNCGDAGCRNISQNIPK